MGVGEEVPREPSFPLFFLSSSLSVSAVDFRYENLREENDRVFREEILADFAKS